eukprot:Trichotokara_eunicae@DN9245_c0_g1_i1.p1
MKKPLHRAFLKTKLCVHHQQGQCLRVQCPFAHGEKELMPKPVLAKTKMCQTFMENGECIAGDECSYAHTLKELKWTEDYYKTSICASWKSGDCNDVNCRYAHGDEELRPREAPIDFCMRLVKNGKKKRHRKSKKTKTSSTNEKAAGGHSSDEGSSS